MTDLEKITLTARNYKSFNEVGFQIDFSKKIHVLVGRNNSGKSAIIDVIDIVCNKLEIDARSYHASQRTQIYIYQPLSEKMLRRAFQESTSGGDLGGNHWHSHGARLIGQTLEMEYSQKKFLPRKFMSTELAAAVQARAAVVEAPDPFLQFRLRRLSADRDIVPEEQSDVRPMETSGRFFTNNISSLMNMARHPSQLVEGTLLAALNRIFSPDAQFSDVNVQLLDSGAWEIFLTEPHKGRIAVSASGSGLKTALLVASLFEIGDYIDKVEPGWVMFGIEEPENNLHPALQRRLLSYVAEKVMARNSHCFITTHSNVVIDFFAKENSAQIIHVAHDGRSAQTRVVATTVDHHGILDDLDVRASDLLQANSIVWVEGPSDRLYFNRWVWLWSEGRLSEGVHYQCVFYGGRLLAHLDATAEQGADHDAVRILRVNRKALVLMDSDKRWPSAPINETKKRIRAEIEGAGGISWVTQGREVENYLPAEALRSLHGDNLPPIRRYEALYDYLAANASDAEAKKFVSSKTTYAEKIIPHIKKEDAKRVLDLDLQMTAVVEAIKRWNGERDRV